MQLEIKTKTYKNNTINKYAKTRAFFTAQLFFFKNLLKIKILISNKTNYNQEKIFFYSHQLILF